MTTDRSEVGEAPLSTTTAARDRAGVAVADRKWLRRPSYVLSVALTVVIFVLDVGFAPGRTDLSLFLGPEPFARFSGVPPGTYYLRLRGGNEVGGGRPSDEVAVRVR